MVGYAYEARPYRTQYHAILDIRYEYSNSLIGIANIISYTVYAYIYIYICYQNGTDIEIIMRYTVAGSRASLLAQQPRTRLDKVGYISAL